MPTQRADPHPAVPLSAALPRLGSTRFWLLAGPSTATNAIETALLRVRPLAPLRTGGLGRGVGGTRPLAGKAADAVGGDLVGRGLAPASSSGHAE